MLALLTACLAACGQGHRAVQGGDAITKAAYVDRVNEICAHYNALQESLGQPVGTVDQQAATTHQINLLSLRKIAEARRVPPPLGARRVTREILDRFEEAVKTADSSTRLVSTNTAAANAATETALRMMSVVTVELNGYGLTECSR
jgi:hypothetical protein